MTTKTDNRTPETTLRRPQTPQMRRMPRVVLVAGLVALAPVLSACESLDLDKLDVFGLSDKKKLPGERRAVFPEGVPGVTQGIPQEYIRGQQPPAETADVMPTEPARAAAPAAPAAPPRARAQARPRPATAAAPARRAPSAQPAAQPAQQPAAWPEPAQQARPAQPAQQQDPQPWPSPTQGKATAPWPSAPPPGSFSR